MEMVPTAHDPPTGRQWVKMIASEFKVKPKVQVAGKGMVRFLGIFMPIMREMTEMMYQYDRDYVFNSAKFEKTFDFKPTSYQDGLRQIVEN